MTKGDLVRVRSEKKCMRANKDVETEGYNFTPEMVHLFCDRLFEIEEIFYAEKTHEKFYVLYDDIELNNFYFKKSMLKMILKGGE